MPPRKWKLRVRHILDSIDKIQRYTCRMTFEDFKRDEKTVDAVITNILLIGEAARHVPEHIQTAYPSLPWPQMRAMRNVLIHEYDRVDLRTVWTTLAEDLAPLVPMLRQILENEDDAESTQ